MSQSNKHLLRLIDEISALMRRKDAAGFILVHKPNARTEYKTILDTTWSCAYPTPVGFRLKSNKQLHGERLHEIQTNTVAMVRSVADVLGMNTLGLMKFADMVDEAFQAQHGEIQLNVSGDTGEKEVLVEINVEDELPPAGWQGWVRTQIGNVTHKAVATYTADPTPPATMDGWLVKDRRNGEVVVTWIKPVKLKDLEAGRY